MDFGFSSLGLKVSEPGLKSQWNEDVVKKPQSILKTIFVGVVALVGGGVLLAGLFVVMLLLGGPYSDSQFAPRRYSPIANITLVEITFDPLWWDVDERFAVEFDNGFVLKKGVKLSDFPESLAVRQGEVSYYSGKPLTVYMVREKGASNDCMNVSVDENQEVLHAEIGINAHSNASFKDLKSQKSIRLYETSHDEMVAFFKSLPK